MNEKEILVKIEGKDWQEALDKAYEKASKKAKLDGFRLGHAPKDLFLKKYGKESLYMDASDIALEKAYAKVFTENKDLKIVAQPDIDLKSIDDKAVVFNFKLVLKPTVKLGKYKGLKIKKEEVEVTKEEIDKAIDDMRNHYKENIVKEGNLEKGNIAIIDFEGYRDNVPFEGGKGENYSLTIGSNTFIPGFEEQLIGMNVNENREVKVTFPDDYNNEELKGKEAIFKVKLNDIKEVKVPELNKEFFEDLAMEGINSKETLEKQVKENLEAKKTVDNENKYIDKLLEEASKGLTVEIPEVMIKEETNRILKQYGENLKAQGLTLEQFYQFTNSTEEALREQMKEEATKRVTYRLMLEQIALEEKITITDEKVDKEADALANKYQMEKEEFLKAFGGLDMIKYDLEMRSAIEILKEN